MSDHLVQQDVEMAALDAAVALRLPVQQHLHGSRNTAGIKVYTRYLIVTTYA
jgi:imidazolonepropionase-like amidohydrolase